MSKFWLMLVWLGMNLANAGLIAYEQGLLETKDVSKIMHQILSEHLGKKEVTNKVLQHALLIYINQFDPARIYLLAEEIEPFTELSSEQLDQAIKQYKQSDFAIFKNLNDVIQSSILRSRKIRQQLEVDAKNHLFHQKQEPFSNKGQDWTTFATSVSDLGERILQDLAKYIKLQTSRYGDPMSGQRKEQILHAYELKLTEFENQYLYQNSKGQTLPLNEQENLFTIHVLKSLANSLDAHTSFYKSNEAYDIRVRLQKEFKGIGLVLKDTLQGPIVTDLLQGGAAERSKEIQGGDILTEVDGKSVADQSFETVMGLLHGEKNSHIKLTFKRAVQKEQPEKIFTVDLQRELITLNNDRVDVTSQPFGNGIIGIIALHSFYQGNGVSSEKDVRDAIDTLEKKGSLRGLIFDLRDNSGGFLSQAVKVAGLFITDGVIVISKYANGEEKFYRDVERKTPFEGPLIVLTSKMTASAAEIVAQALQDYGVALVVGDEHTYGKGTIQTQTVTDNQSTSYFKVTVGKYYTVSGNTPQKHGVLADIVVPGRWNNQEIGEIYADSEDGDTIPPAYNDSLQDVSPETRSWYLKYYIPHLQHRLSVWRNLLPTLRKNSEYRISQNKNYQFFLKGKVVDEDNLEDEESQIYAKKKTSGEDDLQVQESVNILKDMILLHSLNPEKNRSIESKKND